MTLSKSKTKRDGLRSSKRIRMDSSDDELAPEEGPAPSSDLGKSSLISIDGASSPVLTTSGLGGEPRDGAATGRTSALGLHTGNGTNTERDSVAAEVTEAVEAAEAALASGDFPFDEEFSSQENVVPLALSSSSPSARLSSGEGSKCRAALSPNNTKNLPASAARPRPTAFSKQPSSPNTPASRTHAQPNGEGAPLPFQAVHSYLRTIEVEHDSLRRKVEQQERQIQALKKRIVILSRPAPAPAQAQRSAQSRPREEDRMSGEEDAAPSCAQGAPKWAGRFVDDAEAGSGSADGPRSKDMQA